MITKVIINFIIDDRISKKELQIMKTTIKELLRKLHTAQDEGHKGNKLNYKEQDKLGPTNTGQRVLPNTLAGTNTREH